MSQVPELDTEDAKVFGGMLVYCASHRRAHATGWCTVDVENKLGLGIDRGAPNAMHDAAEKCRRLGLRLFEDEQSNKASKRR